MGAKSSIEWTDASWSPIRARDPITNKIGWHCEHVTTGCINCYAEGMNKRLGTGLQFKPGHRKDIEIFLDEEMLLAPLRWKKPRKIFPCSMTDAFADFVKDGWLDKIFAVMARAHWHTYQVLTKRSERMQSYLSNPDLEDCLTELWQGDDPDKQTWNLQLPLANVWCGVSAERQQEWDERKEHLKNTPAAVHFASFEPLLGGIVEPRPMSDFIQWAIVGGESGPKARPMHPDWVRSLQRQCDSAGVRFFFKQWGGWWPDGQASKDGFDKPDPEERFVKLGKKAAGRLLDGREWNQMPEVRT